MKLTAYIFQPYKTFQRNFQNGTTMASTAPSLMVFLRVYHDNLFLIKENCFCKRECLLSSTAVIDITKRNASKKAKDKKKGGKAPKGKLDLSIGADVVDLGKIQSGMVNATKKLADEFQRKYSPKLSANTLDNIRVKIDGSISSLYEVAEVKSGEKEFFVVPSSGTNEVKKTLMDAIEKSLNVSTSVQGKMIRIPISIASSEYKESILQLAKESAERCKVDIRKIRQQGIVKAKKASKDSARLIENQIQLLTDMHNQEVDNMISKKKQEFNSDKK